MLTFHDTTEDPRMLLPLVPNAGLNMAAPGCMWRLTSHAGHAQARDSALYIHADEYVAEGIEINTTEIPAGDPVFSLNIISNI